MVNGMKTASIIASNDGVDATHRHAHEHAAHGLVVTVPDGALTEVSLS